MSDILNIIKQIQSDIINPQVSLEIILLKAKVLAHYLDNQEFKKWVKNEVDGYPNTNNLPDYRIIGTYLLGTFFNGFYRHSNKIISMNTIPTELLESVGKVYLLQGIVGLDGMAKSKKFRNPMSGDWVELYNIFNAEFLSYGNYQLIEAYHPITDTSINQTLGAIRSRLQDFVLEISSLSWDMAHEPLLSEQIAKIFQVTIYHNSGEINMSDFQQKDNTYNLNQAKFGGGFAGTGGTQTGGTFNDYSSNQNLSEAAREIQKLLKQLELSNPTTTEIDKVTVAAKAAEEIKKNPMLKDRAIAALKSGGTEAFKEAVDHPLVNILVAIIEGWTQGE